VTLTGNPSALGAVEYELETDADHWAEIVNTFGTRLSHVGMIDCSKLVHAKQEPGHAEQYRGAGGQWVLMGKDGEFEITLDLTGHGSTTEGTPAVHANETFIGWVFGGGPTLSLATSQTLTGGTAAAPTTSGANGGVAGGLFAIGDLDDGDGDGQMYPASAHAGSALTLLAALRGAPANGAKLDGVYNMYLPSSPTAGYIVGGRFRLQTANMQYSCHGCFPKSYSIKTVGPNGRPQLTVTIGVSRWFEVAATFPSVLDPNKLLPAPVAAGSLHVNAVGTSDRNELFCTAFEINVSINVEIVRGPGGVDAYQTIIGAKRVTDSITVKFRVDADAATTTPLLPGWGRGTTSFSIMYTLSTSRGSRVGFWFPKVCSRTVPVQINDANINRFEFEGEAYTSDTLTTELTRSRMVMGYA
jgi:hypothetical protein